MIPKLEKSFLLVCRVCQDELIYEVLKFDQYSHLVIRLNIFWFSAINSKLEKVFIRLELVESNPLI